MIVIIEVWDDWDKEVDKRIVLEGQWTYRSTPEDVYNQTGEHSMKGFIEFLKKFGFVETDDYFITYFDAQGI